MRKLLFAACLFSIAAIVPVTPAMAQAKPKPGQEQTSAEALQLYAKAEEHSKAGRYAEAIALARRALTMLEKAYGNNHVGLWPYILGLSEMYQQQAHYSDAEAVNTRVLTIMEGALAAHAVPPCLLQSPGEDDHCSRNNLHGPRPLPRGRAAPQAIAGHQRKE